MSATSSFWGTRPTPPRFGFTSACAHGIGLTIDVPDEALMALTLDADHPLPGAAVRYAAPFGI